MQGDLSPLEAYLDRTGVDGYLIEAADESSQQGYLSGFWAPDSYATLYTDGAIHCLVKPLEVGRAREESHAETVANVTEYGFFDRLETAERHEAWAGCIADFCADHGASSLGVPARFPVSVAEALGEAGLSITVDHAGVIDEIRAVKTEPELEAIAEAQAAAEAAMATTEELLAAATIGPEGRLDHDGDPLTSERVKTAIEATLLEHRCALDDTIVACGADAADPHDRGTGPLVAGEPIIVDIFPQHKETRYCGDLTRTFVKGEADDAHQRWYDLTSEAMEAAFDALEAGTTGAAVHAAVCDVYESAGEATLRSDPTTDTGFIHSTGHGVGLDVHESPSLSVSGEALAANHVVTVEPGLYDPAVGGVRIEDLVVVTADGYHNLTEYPKRFVID